jgi:hypothetical protein
MAHISFSDADLRQIEARGMTPEQVLFVPIVMRAKRS